MTKYEDIGRKLKSLRSDVDHFNFLFSFLRAFNFPEATISRVKLKIKGGSSNHRTFIKNKLLFISTDKANLARIFESLQEQGLSKVKSRFIVIVNDSFFYGFDLLTEDALVCHKNDLYKYVDFFLPLIGIEKTNLDEGKSANEKAAEKFATLYNELYGSLQSKELSEIEGLNTTISRLLFCSLMLDRC